MPSLTSTIFTLSAAADTDLPLYAGRILQASFLKWLQREHPQLVAKLHDANYPRPYTVSDLHGDFERRNGRLRLQQGAQVWFRLTGMESHFNDAVRDCAEKQGVGPQPDDPRLVPGNVLMAPEAHEWAQSSSYEAIAAEVQRLSQDDRLRESVSLRFWSPACFIENKQSLPLPIPRYVFGYLTNKWQLASPLPLPVEDVQHFVESIHLAYARLETRVVDLQKYRRVGFFGTARFALHPALPLIYRQSLHLLARFAFYCGVGSHTTMGMGQATLLAPGER